MNPLFLDMVHHNPGEARFESRFNDPGELAALGYNGQVLKHLNACVPVDGFPATAGEQAWLEASAADRDTELAAARDAGVDAFYHIDLFVLPKRVIAGRRNEICDEMGRIDVTRPMTLELHKDLLAAMFARFPSAAGLLIRVGETYLFDTPHHDGNTAVPLHDENVSHEEQIRRFIILLRFLREEVCERHGKVLIYRTWDYFGDRFHASADFYQRVTDAIEPHPKLILSIKHTAGDFFRGCVPNPCLGLGRHRQIIEVQCQREYEGKGAFPNYTARGVIDGFPEVPQPLGLRDWRQSPLWAGLWTWSRGGGWFGPYLKNEFWPELHVRIYARWMRDTTRSEAEVFNEVCERDFGMDAASSAAFRELCLLSEEAVWFGRSSPALARHTCFREADIARLWTRDDRLGGLDQLRPVFADLDRAGLLDESICEKKRAADLFRQMAMIAREVRTGDPEAADAIRTSAEYGERLFAMVACGWEIMAAKWKHHREPMPRQLAEYKRLRGRLRVLEENSPLCASHYQGTYWNWPGQDSTPGMDDSVLESARLACASA